MARCDIEPMSYSCALIEWESGGLDDVPTENIVCFCEQLAAELRKRGFSVPAQHYKNPMTGQLIIIN